MSALVRLSCPSLVLLGVIACSGVNADPDSRDPDERRLGTLELGARSDAETVRKIVVLLDDPDDLVREAALRALGRIGHKEFSQHVRPKVHDPSPMVRVTAAEVLVKLDVRPAMEVVLPAWRQEPSPAVRVAVLDILEPHARDPKVTELLIDAVDDKDVRVSFTAHEILTRMAGQPPVPRTKKAWQEWANTRAPNSQIK